MAAISLIMLVAVVLVAWKKRINPGILGILAAFILGFFVMNDKGVAISSVAGKASVIVNAFPVSLFLRIMLPSLFFGIVSINGTLKAVCDKLLGLAHGNQKLFPILLFVVSSALAFAGVNGFTGCIILVPIAVSIAHLCGQPVLLYIMPVWCGVFAGNQSPTNIGHILGYSLAEQNGFAMNGDELIRYLILQIIFFLVYYFAFGGHKLPKVTISEMEEKVVLNRDQIISVIAMVAFVVFAIMGYEISMVAAVLAALMILITKVDEKKAIASVPWATLILIAGMTMCVKMVANAGGIDLLVTFFRQFMGHTTAIPLIVVIAGLMSTVSSATGVVQPTLFATFTELSSVYSVTPGALALAAIIGSQASGISPLSSLGGLALGLTDPEDNKDNNLFNKLFIIAGVNLVFAVIYAFVGGMGA